MRKVARLLIKKIFWFILIEYFFKDDEMPPAQKFQYPAHWGMNDPYFIGEPWVNNFFMFFFIILFFKEDQEG